jgi:hypothetical protein
MPGKRRFTFNLNESVAQIQSGYYGRKQEDKPLQKQPILEEKVTYAKAVPDSILPDIYELFDVNGKSLNKACVQQLELSKMLKAKGSTEIMVNIEYNDDFKRYEIISLRDPNMLN